MTSARLACDSKPALDCNDAFVAMFDTTLRYVIYTRISANACGVFYLISATGGTPKLNRVADLIETWVNKALYLLFQLKLRLGHVDKLFTHKRAEMI